MFLSRGSGLLLSIAVLHLAGCTRDFALPDQEASITVAQDGLTVAPRETLQLTVEGGTTPLIFSLALVGTGDPTLEASTGLYRAGQLGGGRDLIEVRDGAGRIGRATVRTGPALLVSVERLTLSAGGTASFRVSGGKPGYTVHLEPDAVAPAVNDRPEIGTDPLFCDDYVAPDPCERTADLEGVGEGEIWVRTAGPRPRQDGDGQETGYLWIDGSTNRCTLDGVPWGERVDQVTVTDGVGETRQVELRSGDPLVAVLDSFTVHAGEERRVVVSGGSSPYRTRLAYNRSGGTLDEATGQYRPGYSANALDGVLVSDAVGAICFLEVDVRGQRYATGHLTDAVLADLDGDGVDDLVAADSNASGGGLWVGRNRPFASPEVTTYAPARRLLPFAVAGGVLASGQDLVLALDPEWRWTYVLEPDFAGNLLAPQVLVQRPITGIAWSGNDSGWLAVGSDVGFTVNVVISRLFWDFNLETWGVETRLTIPGEPDLPSMVDLDGDRSADLVLLDPLAGKLRVVWGPAFNLLLPSTRTLDLKAVNLEQGVSIRSGDLDGDGVQDLVVADRRGAKLYPVYGRLDRALVAAAPVLIARVNESGPLAFWLVPDDRMAAVIYRDGGALFEYRGWSSGWSGPDPAFFQNDLGFRPVDLAVGDVNGDGAPDVVPVGGSLTSPVYLGSGEGTFGWRQRFGPGLPGGVDRGWFLDADGIDREDDLITVEGNALEVWAGTLSVLTLAARFDAGRSGALVGLGDLDGDGDRDALRYAPGNLFVQRRIDDRFETQPLDLEGVPLAARAHLADFDGDGTGESVIFEGGQVVLAIADLQGLDPADRQLLSINRALPRVGANCSVQLLRDPVAGVDRLASACMAQNIDWEIFLGAPTSNSGTITWTSFGTFAHGGEQAPVVLAIHDGRVVVERWGVQSGPELVTLDGNGTPEFTGLGSSPTGALVSDLDGDGQEELLVGTENEALLILRRGVSRLEVVGGTSIPGRPWGWMKLAIDPKARALVVQNGREVLLVLPEELGVP